MRGVARLWEIVLGPQREEIPISGGYMPPFIVYTRGAGSMLAGSPSQTNLPDKGSITAWANQSHWKVMVMFSHFPRPHWLPRVGQTGSDASQCQPVTRDD